MYKIMRAFVSFKDKIRGMLEATGKTISKNKQAYRA
jgi:hypothetical protein